MTTLNELALYNSIDAAATLQIHNALLAQHSQSIQSSEGEEWPFQQTYDMTMRLREPLVSMMSTGVRVDKKALALTRDEAAKEIDIKLLELEKLCGHPLNPNSNKQCAQYFYEEKRIPPYRSRKTGNVTTDDKAMSRLVKGTAARPGLPEAKLIQEIRALRKLLGTYLDIVFDEDDRLRCSYNIRGSKYGRLSSTKTIHDTGMNMQNLPEAFLAFLIPDPGMCFLSFDKAGAEWVVVAFLAEDPLMMEVVENGLDPHLRTAYLMFNLPEDLIKEEAKNIGHTTDPLEIEKIREGMGAVMRAMLKSGHFLPRNMSLRQAAKKANHGLNYDEGAKEFAFQNEIVDKDAKRIVDLYHEAYPGIRNKFHRGVKESLRKTRTLENCFGRRIKLLDKWGPDLWKSAYSAIPQSTVVDLVNQGLCSIYEDRSPWMLESEILMQVHDSVMLQTPINPQLPRVTTSCLHHLDPVLSYGLREFHIRTDIKVGMNGRDMVEVRSGEEALSWVEAFTRGQSK